MKEVKNIEPDYKMKREVFGPYERLLSNPRTTVVKDYSKSPDIDSAITLSAAGHGVIVKSIDKENKGVWKKNNPLAVGITAVMIVTGKL